MRESAVEGTFRPACGRLLALVLAGWVLGSLAHAAPPQAQAPAPALTPRRLQDNLAAKTYSGHRIDLLLSIY